MYTIAGIALARLRGQIESVGLDAAPILSAVDLAPDGRSAGLIPLDSYLRAKGLAAQQLGAPDLGLRWARMYTWRSQGLMGHLISHSPTLGQALRRRMRYGTLWKRGDRLEVEHRGAHVFVGYALAPVGSALGRRVDLDECLAFFLRVAQLLAGRPLRFEEVHFPYPPPDDVGPYLATFAGSHLAFDRPRAGLLVRSEVLDWLVPAADPSLLPHLEVAATHRPSDPEQPTFADQAEYLIGLALPAVPTLEQIARSLGVSERTAARRWESEGTSYRGLVDRVRLRLARAMLADRDLPIAEIAHRLGFASAASFHRAYVRWTGETPGARR